MIWREACGVLSQNERNIVSIGLREQKAFEIPRRLSRIRTLSRTIERADTPKKAWMWSLCTRLCSKRAHWAPRAHTPPPLFRTREIFRPKRKKGREDENRVVIKNNAKENSRERANSLFTFDSCYKRTFLTVFVRTRPIFYACVVSVCLKWTLLWMGRSSRKRRPFLGGVRESLNQDSPRNFSPFLLLPHNHTIKNIQELLNHVDNFPRWHESYRGY